MIECRFARAEDSQSIANLLSELGYQADEKTVSKRLFKIKDRNGEVIVAENQNELLGCVHVFMDLRLAEGEVGEIVSLVVKSEFRDGKVTINEGEMFVVPKGVEHKPVAKKLCKILLIEPKGVMNTGDVDSPLTAENDNWI